LGFVGSSPPKKGIFYETFLQRLPEGLDVDSAKDMTTIVDAWKMQIESCITDSSLWKGGTSNPASRKPGFLLPTGVVHFWDKNEKKWKQNNVSTI